jgi:hypothetical protein
MRIIYFIIDTKLKKPILLNNDYPTFFDKFFINKKFVILSQKITTIEQI